MGHSLRADLATCAAVPGLAIMAQTGRRSLATLLKYPGGATLALRATYCNKDAFSIQYAGVEPRSIVILGVPCMEMLSVTIFPTT